MASANIAASTCATSLRSQSSTDRERLLQEILVNGQIRIEEERTTDNWNGGTYGHGLFLTLPETIYLKSARERGALQEGITQDLNSSNPCFQTPFAALFAGLHAAGR